MSEALQAAREAYGRGDWPRARELYTAARAAGELSADDLYALSDAAWWTGAVDESITVCEQAYRAYLAAQQPRQAAMAAFDVAANLFLRGDDVRGFGWMGRTQRLLADEPEGAEHGYVRYLLEVEAALGGVAPPDGTGLDSRVGGQRLLPPHVGCLGGDRLPPGRGMDRSDRPVAGGHARRRRVHRDLPGASLAGPPAARRMGTVRGRRCARVRCRGPLPGR